jgi:hypothetical protein
MPYIPRLLHSVALAFICIAMVALGAFVSGRVLTAMNIGAAMFGVMAFVILVLVVFESWRENVRVMVDWMIAFGKLDDEARAAVAFTFPTMRYRMKMGEVRGMFEDTQVPIEMFRLFLQTSNSKYISPERDWTTAEQPRWAWLEIKGWLEENKHIIPDSAAGSHSWLWNGNAFQHLMAYWTAGRKLVDMSDRVYAYEEEGEKLA